MTARPGEHGTATVLATAVIALVVFVGAAVSVAGGLVVDHRRAQAAADLAALAGAQALQREADACRSAGSVARANGATLTTCSVQGSVVTVEVSVSGPRWLGQHADLAARARAGPGRPG